jgi:uncharacterized protein
MDAELCNDLKQVLASLKMLLPKPAAVLDWQSCHAASWRKHYLAGYLEPVEQLDALALSDLLGIEKQKKMVEDNTLQFLSGFPANNVLLWGTRGTGKSSLVRAILNAYAPKGLRIIQVDKDDLCQLPDIVDSVKQQPYRFILFSDDVSFEVGESSYKMLKSALDGAVYALPENIRIYVTSNRRHLIPEYETDNRGAMMVNNEIHHGESAEEKISLSGRFGIWVGFHPFTQDQYLDVVHTWISKLCFDKGISDLWNQETREQAIQWGNVKGDKSGRIAYQFACDLVGRNLLGNTTVH